MPSGLAAEALAKLDRPLLAWIQDPKYSEFDSADFYADQRARGDKLSKLEKRIATAVRHAWRVERVWTSDGESGEAYDAAYEKASVTVGGRRLHRLWSGPAPGCASSSSRRPGRSGTSRLHRARGRGDTGAGHRLITGLVTGETARTRSVALTGRAALADGTRGVLLVGIGRPVAEGFPCPAPQRGAPS